MALDGQSPAREILKDPPTASANINSSVGVISSNTSIAPVGVPGNAEDIIKYASLCTFVSFFTRYNLLSPHTQDTLACVKIGRIIAVYIRFMMCGFMPHFLSTICLHCISAAVALRVIRVT